MRVEKVADGWMIAYNHRFVHLTVEWCEQIHKDQFAVHGHQNAALNNLRWHLANGDPTAEQVSEWFEDFYGEIGRNSSDRKNLGLKPVTKHGHEDLEAVRGGADVRPWNAAKPQRSESFEEFIRGNRENSR